MMNQQSYKPTPGTKWVMLALSYLVLLGAFLPYIGWTPKLTTIMDDLAISYAEAGLLTSVTALVGGVILPFAGMIGDKWGVKNVIVVGLVASIVGQLMFAYVDVYSLALVARAISGLGVGLLFVGPYTMAVNWFHESGKNGIALGVMFTSDGVGTAFALYLFALVLTALGWRSGLTTSALVLAALLVVTLLFLKNAPTPSVGPEDQEDRPATSGRHSWLAPALDRNVLVATAFFIGEWGIFALVSSWMPTILIEGAGWSATTSGLFSSLYVLAGIVTAILFGLLSDRIGHRRIMITIAGLAITIFVGGLTLSLAADNYVLATVFLPLIGLGIYTGMPLSLAQAVESAGSGNAGVVNGVVLGTGFVLGGFVYPYVLGYVKDVTGSFVGGFFGVTVATLVLCFLAALFGRDVELVRDTDGRATQASVM